MTPTFDFTINIPSLVAVSGVIYGVLKVNGKLSKLVFQHDMMWEDYCNRHGINPRLIVAGAELRKGAANGS